MWIVGPLREHYAAAAREWHRVVEEVPGVVVRPLGRLVIARTPRISVIFLGTDAMAAAVAARLGPMFRVRPLDASERREW